MTRTSVAKLTLNVVFETENRTLETRKPGYRFSGGVDLRGVYQHDWDVILDGVDPAALAAFQTVALRTQSHRLLANRADQHIEQILRNHSGSIVAQRQTRRITPHQTAICAAERTPTTETQRPGEKRSRLLAFALIQELTAPFSVTPCLRGEVLVCGRYHPCADLPVR